MKKLILFELALLFLATTFSSAPPPGWYQQTLPVNDFVRDIFFLDSLNGWAATVSYVLRTTNGGDNWVVADSSNNSYYKIQFFDVNIGYRCGVLGGGGASVWKTTNGGYNWDLKHNFGFGFGIEDMQFLNEDTGWISSSSFMFGGIWKTTDGGNSWDNSHQPTPRIQSIFFLNSDTGWVITTDTQGKLYRTTNGINWNLQYTFPSSLGDICFFNPFKGVISSGRFYNTTDGGFNWTPSPSQEIGGKLSFANDSIGWAGLNINYFPKTTNGGVEWIYQSSPIVDNSSISIIDNLHGWAGGTGIVKTTNGGITTSIGSNVADVPFGFFLYQNYPNPFNPNTNINYELRITGFVTLKVYNIQGKEIQTVVNKKQNSGNYNVEFDGSSLNSGVYFYLMEITDEKGNKMISKIKKMLLVK